LLNTFYLDFLNYLNHSQSLSYAPYFYKNKKKLNVKISKDAEFYSIYDKNQETFNINNND